MKIQHLICVLGALIYTFAQGNSCVAQQNKAISIEINYVNAKPIDTLTIIMADNMLSSLSIGSDEYQKRKFTSVINSTGSFQFTIPVVSQSGYLGIFKNRILDSDGHDGLIPICKPQFWEENDSIIIDLIFKETPVGGDGMLKFAGRGSGKYNLDYEIEHLTVKTSEPRIVSDSWPKGWDGNILKYDAFDKKSTLTATKLNFLQVNRSSLSDLSFNIMRANIIFNQKGGWLGMIDRFAQSKEYAKLSLTQKDRFYTRLTQSYDSTTNYAIKDEYLAQSIDYLNFMLKKCKPWL